MARKTAWQDGAHHKRARAPWRITSSLCALASTTFCCLALASAAFAISPSLTWTGRTAFGKEQWSLAGNWLGGTAPTAGESIATLTFPELTNPGCAFLKETESCYFSFNDLPGLSVESLQIDDGDDYLIGGEALSLGKGGLTASPPSHSVGSAGSFLLMPLQLSAAQKWTIGNASSSKVGENGVLLAGSVTGPATSSLALELHNGPALFLKNSTEVGPVTIEGPNTTGEHIANGVAVLRGGELNSQDGQPLNLKDVYFAGTGFLGPLTVSAATLAAGSGGMPAGALEAPSVKLNSASATFFEVDGAGTTAQQDYSQLLSKGSAELSGLILVFSEPPSRGASCPVLTRGSTYTFLSAGGPLTGSFSNAPEGGPEVPIHFSPSCPSSSQTIRIAYDRTGATETVTGTVEAAAAEREEKEKQEGREHQEAKERQEKKEASERETKAGKESREAQERAEREARAAREGREAQERTEAAAREAAKTGVAGFQAKANPLNPDAELAGTSLQASASGIVTVGVSCPPEEGSCAGTVSLRTLTAVSARLAGTAKRKAAVLLLASGSFTVAGGAVAKVKLRLSAKALTLLSRSRQLRARATIAAHDPEGATHTAQTIVTLHAAKSKHGKR